MSDRDELLAVVCRELDKAKDALEQAKMAGFTVEEEDNGVCLHANAL